MYNKYEVKSMIEEIKQFNITTTKKVFHKTQFEEVRKILHKCMSINSCLFEPEYFYSFSQYKISINCGETKKILDGKLKYCLNEILGQLYSILNVIETCEYDEEKQRYIEKVS